jgi:dimethylamine/trimethylamine dehydrogenase
MNPTKRYLQTLLTYYEEEVSGEAYFVGLAEHFAEHKTLMLLAKVERHAAQSVLPLLDKYALSPRGESILKAEGEEAIQQHQNMGWLQFMAHIVQRYPDYLDEFLALQAMAPREDLLALKILTDHEVAAIDFARREIAGDPDSLDSLNQYLHRVKDLKDAAMSLDET